MKPGTIVVIIKCDPTPDIMPYVRWLPCNNAQTEYMIRELRTIKDSTKTRAAVTFEEGIIGYYDGLEIMFPIEWVREVLPAQDISELIEECMTQTVECSS